MGVVPGTEGSRTMRQAAWTAGLFALGLLMASSDAAGQTASGPPIPADVAKCLEDGHASLRGGRFEKAIKAFTKADRLSGGSSAPALLGVATAHLQMAHFDEAVDQAEKALSLATDPGDQAMAHNLIGTGLWGIYSGSPFEQTDDPASLLEQAESAFSQALRLSGGNLNIAWSNLALVLEKEGRFADAEAVLQEYVKRVPESQSAQQRMIRLGEEREWAQFDEQWMGLVREGQLAEAVSVIEEYGVRSPGHPRAGTRLCWLQVAGLETGENRYDASELEFDVAETRTKATELPIEVGGGVEPPEFIEGPEPIYTEEARIAQIYGKVILEAVVDKEGDVRCVAILEDLPMGLGEAAVAAVKQWHFKPATLHGKPVNVEYTFTIGFSID